MSFLIKLFQCFFCWRIKVSEMSEIQNTEVIIAQSFGIGKNNTPGLSNEKLAIVIKKIKKYFNVPIIAQREIVDCLPKEFKAERVSERRIKGVYLDTYEVLYQSWEICKKNGWRKAIIIAHPDHLWRVVQTAKKIGFKTIIVDVSSVSYDRKSVQWWTKFAIFFMPWEILGRILFLFRGWI